MAENVSDAGFDPLSPPLDSAQRIENSSIRPSSLAIAAPLCSSHALEERRLDPKLSQPLLAGLSLSPPLTPISLTYQGSLKGVEHGERPTTQSPRSSPLTILHSETRATASTTAPALLQPTLQPTLQPPRQHTCQAYDYVPTTVDYFSRSTPVELGPVSSLSDVAATAYLT